MLVFRPISANAKLRMNPRSDVDFSSPKVDLVVNLPEVAIKLSRPQVRDTSPILFPKCWPVFSPASVWLCSKAWMRVFFLCVKEWNDVVMVLRVCLIACRQIDDCRAPKVRPEK